MIMTRMINLGEDRIIDFFKQLVLHFGLSGTHSNIFKLFSSENYELPGNKDPTHHLMFSDFTKNIYTPLPTETETYYRWIGRLLIFNLNNNLNKIRIF